LCDAGFTANDIGKTIGIAKAGDKGTALRTKIRGIVSNEKVTLELEATSTVSDSDVTWGTDDTAVLKKAIDEAHPGDTIFFPSGIYCAHNLYLKPGISFVSLEGVVRSLSPLNISESCISVVSTRGAVLTQFIGDNSTFFFSDHAPIGALSDITFQGLIFDGNVAHNSKTCELLF
jgi:hypothetical protein